VHFTPGEQQVRAGDIVTTMITQAAPHHLIADGDVISHRRTRAGDAAAQRPSGVGLGMPGVGQPAAAPASQDCSR
jgi:tRNA-2-methylthio-N6-dimethylallyladenosine synthase